MKPTRITFSTLYPNPETAVTMSLLKRDDGATAGNSIRPRELKIKK